MVTKLEISSRNITEKLKFIFCTIFELNSNRGFQYKHKSPLHEAFCESYTLDSLIKEPTCYENP